MFHDRFDGNVPVKCVLKVRLISDKEYCKVEFRATPYTTENNNLLSVLRLRISALRLQPKVSHLFKLPGEMDWKN